MLLFAVFPASEIARLAVERVQRACWTPLRQDHRPRRRAAMVAAYLWLSSFWAGREHECPEQCTHNFAQGILYNIVACSFFHMARSWPLWLVISFTGQPLEFLGPAGCSVVRG